MAVRLFVGNLSYSTTEADLRTYFATVAPPSHVVLPVDRETGRPRGFAFVEFLDRAHAEQAIQKFNGQALNGRPLSVSEARAREDRGPAARRGLADRRERLALADSAVRRDRVGSRRVRSTPVPSRLVPRDAPATSGRTPNRSGAAVRKARRRTTSVRAVRFR